MKKLISLLPIFLPFVVAAQCTTNVSITSSATSDTVCAGSSVTLTANGTSLASYSWSNGATTSSIMVAVQTSSEYYVSVVDSNSCTWIDSITISTDQFNIALPTTYNVCGNSGSGGTTGGTLYPSISGGGVHPYTFLWSNGITTAGLPLAGITSGSYTLTANDANNCEPVTAVVNINVDTLRVTENVLTPATCPGSITVVGANISGGTSPFVYQWTPGGTGSTDTLIAPSGISTVGSICFLTVTDSNGCSANAFGGINPSDNLSVSLPSTLNICGNQSVPTTIGYSGGKGIALSSSSGTGQNGFIDEASNTLFANVYGGVTPYTYSWNNGDTTQGIPLSAGNYTVNVSDSNGCTVSASCTVIYNQPPTITINCSRNVIHPGSWDTLTASGATTYYWSNGITGNQIIVHAFHTNEYTVYGYDSLGCGASAQMPVIVTLDPWLPSPDTTLAWNSPIYFPGNVAIGTYNSKIVKIK